MSFRLLLLPITNPKSSLQKIWTSFFRTLEIKGRDLGCCRLPTGQEPASPEPGKLVENQDTHEVPSGSIVDDPGRAPQNVETRAGLATIGRAGRLDGFLQTNRRAGGRPRIAAQNHVGVVANNCVRIHGHCERLRDLGAPVLDPLSTVLEALARPLADAAQECPSDASVGAA